LETAAELLRQGRREEVWRRYCGFLDLSLAEFMEIQERLLVEQIGLLSKCELGRNLLQNTVPQNAEVFREMVPLTTYRDYFPYLDQRQEDVLPSETILWARTSGRSGEYGFKWVPYTRAMIDKVGEFAVASFLLASCSGRWDVRLEPEDVLLYTLAPPPYFTGAAVARGLAEQLDPSFIPPLEVGNEMEFGERIAAGFKMAMRSGIDLFYGLSSVLVAVAEQFSQRSSSSGFSLEMLHPQILYRLIRGMVRSKISGRPLLPRDLWKVKGIVAGGMDTAVFRDAIEELWGRKPLEGYGGTELGGIALQAWNYKGMNFLPDYNFLEFISEEDFFRSRADPSFRPSTLLVDELKPGVYELVITNFHGGIFMRYKTGDLVEVISLRDDELDIDIPQIVFHARADGVIDLGGFTRLTEKAVLHAIAETEIPCVDWTVRKEYVREKPVLHLFLEAKDGVGAETVRAAVHQRLKEKDPGYAELEEWLALDPLRVTMLPHGAFQRYISDRRAAGAEMAHLKPPHINPSDEIIDRLLSV
jgi:hypothetical protein